MKEEEKEEEEEEKEEQEEQEEKEEEKEEEQKEEKEEPVEQGKGRRSSAGRQHLLSPQAADSATMNMVVGINGGREQEHHNQLGKNIRSCLLFQTLFEGKLSISSCNKVSTNYNSWSISLTGNYRNNPEEAQKSGLFPHCSDNTSSSKNFNNLIPTR